MVAIFSIDDKFNEVSAWERAKAGAFLAIDVLPIGLEISGSVRATLVGSVNAGRVAKLGPFVAETVEVAQASSRPLPARLSAAARPGVVAPAEGVGVSSGMARQRPTIIYSAPPLLAEIPFDPNALQVYPNGVTGKPIGLGIDYTRHTQFFDNSCQAMASLHLAWEATGRSISELTVALRLEGLGLWSRKIATGMPDAAVTELLNDAVLSIGARSSSANLTIYEMADLLKDGYWLENVVRTNDGGLHAVALKRFISDAGGMIRQVEYFDPGVGKVLSMDACDFETILAPAGVWANTQVFQFR